ncbi:hypothetical protein GCM10011409_32010 [Lentibacillus populi]|uniref:Cytochrome c domain-containing protein n=1 Tax=Lentibacillus populi TaxID=1827502 RepID=A0A9W5TZN6_9BACI|nr:MULTISPECIES: c-type cytochrome [Bacillaceae]MBT2216516.1 cytochrome C [Virgibacillus dakarensis]GGB51999.1 hypothetical protein GCM10011409_32010 [Lentibacillus populi]
MKVNSIIFIVGFLVAFTAGYLFFGSDNSSANKDEQPAETQNLSDDEASADDNQAASDKSTAKSEEGDATVPAEAAPLSRNNCLSCHAIESLGAKGGTTGPDLSNAFTEVEGKHGKPLEEFLKEPTSAVMSGVIGDNPLKDEERKAIIEALKKAAEKGGQS